MEMPALRARASGLSTRRANQDIRPAVAAGLEKKTRRTAVQMDQARADDTTSKAKASLEEKKKQKRVADLEDKQRQDDLAYAKTANHPADRPVASSTVGPETDSEAAGGAVDPVDDSEPVDDLEAEAYKPDDEASSESESTPEDSSEDDAPKRKQKQKKKKKKRSTSRADVIASRATQDSSGTPEEPVKKRKATEEKTSKKDKKTKTSNSGKKSGLDKIGVGLKVAATVAEDDSMVAQGGPALDDDSKEHVERPNGKKGKSKTGQPAPVIAIQPVPSKAPSRTAQRQGAAKWTLKHLPSGTSDEFTNELVPFKARDLAGTLPPWTGLTVKQIQGLADRVYGPGVHTVTLESAWVGLIGYRLSDWRSGIASQATRGIEALIAAACASEDVSEYDSDYADDDTLDSGAAGGAVPTDPVFVEEGADAASASASAPAPPAPAADGAPDATVAPKVQKFTFDTPVGISAFVEWALEPHESGTMPFHWKTWGGGVDKKGFLKSHLIAYTYAYHLTCLAAIPGAYTMTRPGDPPKPKSQPVGALILSVQAVQRALQFWRTGEYVNTGKTTSYFSVENWGDHAVEDKKGSERRLVRRTTKYLRSVQQWDEAHWEELKAAASVFVEVASRKRAGSSRSASEAGDDLMLDDDVIILSD